VELLLPVMKVIEKFLLPCILWDFLLLLYSPTVLECIASLNYIRPKIMVIMLSLYKNSSNKINTVLTEAVGSWFMDFSFPRCFVTDMHWTFLGTKRLRKEKSSHRAINGVGP